MKAAALDAFSIREFFKTWWAWERRAPLILSLKLLGFVVGFTAAALIAGFVTIKLQYDMWNTNADRIVRAVEVRDAKSGAQSVMLPFPFGDAARDRLPGVAAVARVQPLRVMLQRDQDRQNELLYFVEPAFLEMFQVKFSSGNPADALEGPSGIVVSRSAAKRYFGDDDPIGKNVNLGGSKDMVVSGVMEDWPADSHIRPEFLLSLEVFFQIVEQARVPRQQVTGWLNCHCYATYLMFEDERHLPIEPSELNELLVASQGEEYAKMHPVELQPLSDVFLGSANYAAYLDHAAKGNPVQLGILSGAGLLLLLVAAINFINFSVAQASLRGHEIAIRRTLGAAPLDITVRMMLEVVATALVALVLAYVVASVLSSVVAPYVGEPLTSAQLFRPSTIAVVTLLAIGVGGLAGLVPAGLFARARPSALLRGGEGLLRAAPLRMGLVALQFIVSSVLIIFGIAMYSQLSYIQGQPLGFDAQNLAVINGEGSHLAFAELQSRFADTPGVSSVVIANAVPTTPAAASSHFVRQGEDEAQAQVMLLNDVSFGFMQDLRIPLVAGRYFDEGMGGDRFLGQWDAAGPNSVEGRPSVVNVIVNRSASQAFGFESPTDAIGEFVRPAIDRTTQYAMAIIGVVEDVRYAGPREAVMPMVYRARDDWQLNFHEPRYFAVRMDSGAVSAVLPALRRAWDQTILGFVSDVSMTEDRLARQNADDRRQFDLISLFMIAVVAISLLGSLGFSAFMLQRQARGLAIRRVLGASHRELAFRLSIPVLWAVAISSIVAWPIAYVLVSGWLESFVLRAPISAGWFASATVGITGLAVLVSYAFNTRLAAVSPLRFLRGV
jgi:putative ABC transport system permease protein